MKGIAPTLVVIALLLISCGKGDEDFSSDEISRLARECNWLEGDRDAIPQEIRDAFVDPAGGSFRWVLETDEVLPGQTFQVAGVNDTDQTVEYGAIHRIEHLLGDDWVPAATFPRQAIAFRVPPGEVGPCFEARTRKDAPPGDYRLVQTVRLNPQADEERSFSAQFKVLDRS